MRLNKAVKRAKENLLYHLVASTAMLAESTPLFVAFETQVAGMTNEVSLNTRLSIVSLTYLGLGYVYGLGRRYLRRAFGITEESRETKQTLHDTIYTATFNALISPPLYLIAGETDLEKIVIGTLCATGFGSINGSPLGYAVDSLEDLTSLKECNRPSYPAFLKKMNSKVKYGLAILLVTGSIGITSWVYSINPNKNNRPQVTSEAKHKDK